MTYCCICTLQKNIAAHAVHYVDLFNPQLKAHPELIPSALKKATLEAFNKSLLTKNPWVFAGVDKASIFTRLSLVGVPLGTMADAKTGLFTGLDEVLMVYPEIERTLRLEEDVLLPVASGTEPDRYHLNPTQKKVIYPYDDKGDNTVLMSESDLKSKYPKVYAYLRKSKEQLERRRDSRKSFSENKTWYQLTRHGSLALFRSPKLFTPGEVQHNSFCYDEVGVAFSVARVFAITSQKVNLWYLLAILNSKLMELQLKAISPPKQGGYSAYSSAFLEKALICRVDGLGGRARKPDCDQNLYATFISLVGNGKCLRSDEIMAFANDRVSAECGDLQSLHDLLVYLAKKMTEGHKQKQNEMGRFHLHLGKTLRFGADSHGNHGIDTLSGKIRLQNYIGDFQKNESELSFAELEKILFKNRSRLGVNLSDAGLMRQLREEYENSLATLLPLKRQLAATDALIDQIVYKLYGLTKSEIAIVEGKSVTRPVEVSTRPPQDTEQYTPVARVGDPRVLLEVIAASALLGPATVAEVAANVTDRALISLGFDEAEDIVREFTRLGWMTQETQARVALSETGIPLAKSDASRSPYVFARDLALAHEKSSGRMVSRILGRLWELNPTHQGAVIIPHPQLPESVIEPDAIEAWIEAQRPKWMKSLEQQMPGFVPALPSARFVSMVRESAGDAWPTKPKAPRDKERLQKSITQQFVQMMFGNLRLPLRDLEIWQSRLDWAGLTMTARNLPGVAGWVWFPVGAFRDKPGEGFRLVEGLVWQKLAFYVHEPEGAAFETQFMSTLYGEYYARQREEAVEYVSLPVVRDRVCYKLRIGARSFEKALTAVFPKSIRGDLPYGMALEVDITPAERNRLGTTIPIVIDGTQRHIIAMRKKKTEGSK